MTSELLGLFKSGAARRTATQLARGSDWILADRRSDVRCRRYYVTAPLTQDRDGVSAPVGVSV
jgi:hypothetical protein